MRHMFTLGCVYVSLLDHTARAHHHHINGKMKQAIPLDNLKVNVDISLELAVPFTPFSC